jgi:hypothetical protein
MPLLLFGSKKMARQKCICDPGVPDADSILASKWPPVSTTDEDIPHAY